MATKKSSKYGRPRPQKKSAKKGGTKKAAKKK
jgi:hypothetical protein